MAYTYTELNPGVGGDKLRTDDLGAGIKLAVSKSVWGATGVANDVVLATPLPASVIRRSGQLMLSDGSIVTVKRKGVNYSALAIGNNELIALVAAKSLRILAMTVVADAATKLRYRSGVAGSFLSGQFSHHAASVGLVTNAFPFCEDGWFETTAGESFSVDSTAAVDCAFAIVYIEV